MLIDWFTVGAQVFNFIILVWLMKRFLYKPVLRAIDAREKKIAAELADAAAKEAEALVERDTFRRKNDVLDEQRAALLVQAREEARAERQRLIEEARTVADTLAARRQETLRDDARNLNEALRLRTQEEVFAIARKTLADLASRNLEDHMVEVFIRRLRETDAATRERLGRAMSTGFSHAIVRSALDLPAESRAAIQQALNEVFAAQIPVRFETAPHLVGGIELSMHGEKVAWSIAEYLESMEKGVTDLLDAQKSSELRQKDLAEPVPRNGR